MKIKVCLISLYTYKLFHPSDERVLPFGGSEVQLYQLGRELAKDQEFEVSFLVGGFYDTQPESENQQIEGGTIRLYKAIPCRNRNVLFDGIADFWRLYRTMKKTSADIYVLRGGGSLVGKVALIVKTILKKKLVYSSAHDRDSNLDFFRNHGILINTLFRYGMRHADVIISQHQGQQVALKKNLGLESTIIKSMYPVGQTLEPAMREHILWVSRLQVWKHPELFVELARHFASERFLLITNSDATNLRKQVGLPPNLMIQENVRFEDIDQYFKKAKIFVNTSDSEGFPNTFVQAAKNGTPIVSLNVDPENMLETYTIGKNARGSFSELLAGVNQILEDVPSWSIMSTNAFRYAQENHSAVLVAQQYKKLFRSLLRPK